jgi:hypothetical protein
MGSHVWRVVMRRLLFIDFGYTLMLNMFEAISVSMLVLEFCIFLLMFGIIRTF